MSRGRVAFAVLALALVGGAAAAIVLAVRARTPVVTVTEARRERLRVVVSASGEVEADTRADVSPPTTGRLEDVRVADGQRVKAGEVIAVMDTEPFELQVEQARAAYRAARAQVSVLRGQGAAADQEEAATTQVRQATSAFESSQRTVESLSELYAQAPAELRPAVRSAVDAARGQAEEAYAGLQAAQAQQAQLVRAEATPEQIEAAEAQADQASAALRLARETMDEATLRAPIDGVVMFNGVTGSLSAGLASAGGAAGADGQGAGAGAAPPSGGDPLAGGFVSPQAAPFTVVRLDSPVFNAGVDEVDIAKISAGMRASVTLDAFPDESFETTVGRVKPSSRRTATGGTVFPVLMPLPDIGKRLFLGMSGNADIRIREVAEAVVVPIEALVEDGGRDYVWVVEGERARKRRIRLGALTDTQAQALEGVRPGADIIVSGFDKLEDGQAVRVR